MAIFTFMFPAEGGGGGGIIKDVNTQNILAFNTKNKTKMTQNTHTNDNEKQKQHCQRGDNISCTDNPTMLFSVYM